MSRRLFWLCSGLAGLTVACGEARDAGRAGGEGHEPCVSCMVSHAGADNAGDGGEAGAEASDAGAPNGTKSGLAIAEVSFWQSLRIPLELRGTSVAANAPIIANKDGILRVYVEPDPDFRAHALSAVLELEVGTDVTSFESRKAIVGASSDATFASTFNFPLDAEQVVADTRYAITVSDPGSGAVLDRFPRSDRSRLDARAASVANRLQLVVVPFVVGGINPDVSPQKMAIFRTRVQAMYPVDEISIAVREPVTSAIEVGPDQGWDALLDSLYAVRAADAPAANVFYYGLFTPQKTFDEYCVSDCTVGYSVVAEPDDVESRGSLGLGIFSDGSNESAPDTMAHELGHALGREHAPCDVGKRDAGPFPYRGGKIGVWGFDAPHHALLDPDQYGDVMGYCSPDWISDFTYRALFERIALVNAELGTKSLGTARVASAYRRVIVGSGGALRWGSTFTTVRAPRGARRAVSMLDREGAVRAEISAVFRPFADAPGGFLLLPESALTASVTAIQLGSAELALPSH